MPTIWDEMIANRHSTDDSWLLREHNQQIKTISSSNGGEIKARCSKCGIDVQKDDRFCRKCGQSLKK